MILRDGDYRPLSLSQSAGRAFTYVRYEADLSPESLKVAGIADGNSLGASPAPISKLAEIGHHFAEKIDPRHFENVDVSGA